MAVTLQNANEPRYQKARHPQQKVRGVAVGFVRTAKAMNRLLRLRSNLFQTRRGFTLIEFMAVLAIVGVLAAMAIPGYSAIVEKMKVQSVLHDLLKLSNLIERYKFPHDEQLPQSLADLKNAPLLDPWGNPYQYLNFNSPDPGVKGKIRKDHNLHPLNSEFDLYSMGPDGDSNAPLTAKASRDDIIWARDGAFIGTAADF